MTIKAKVGKMLLRALEEGVGSGPNEVMIGTTADIYGYGLANVELAISVDHFREIAEAMVTANPDEASKAFGHALKDGIVEQRPFKPLRQTSDEELRATADEVMRIHTARIRAEQLRTRRA